MAKDANFTDFRLQRILLDAFKEKQIKGYKDARVLDALTRTLLFESSRLLSKPAQSRELVQFDISTHQKLSVNQLFCFRQIHVVTKGLFTHPVKSFFILAHNQPIEPEMMIKHPLIRLL